MQVISEHMYTVNRYRIKNKHCLVRRIQPHNVDLEIRQAPQENDFLNRYISCYKDRFQYNIQFAMTTQELNVSKLIPRLNSLAFSS